jgi:RNase P subunit RPR2
MTTPIFTCKQCGKYFAPENNLYKAVYEGQAICVMCRKANGQMTFTSEEDKALFGEEALSHKERDM